MAVARVRSLVSPPSSATSPNRAFPQGARSFFFETFRRRSVAWLGTPPSSTAAAWAHQGFGV